MEYRTLDLTLISAKGVKNSSSFGKSNVYAVVSILGTHNKVRTPVDKHGGSEPTWNFPMKFEVDEVAGQQNRLTLVVKIKAAGMFYDKNLGEVRVPINELMEGIKDEGKAMQFVSYGVRRKSGKSGGSLSFSYKFGEKYLQPVMAYPSGFVAGSSSAYPRDANVGYAQPYFQQQQPGYGGAYAPPSSGYGGYVPPQQPVYAPASRAQTSRLGGGFGTGLLGGALGGLLIGDMMSHAGGGGCGGGGCGGGGCGGGGCGGG